MRYIPSLRSKLVSGVAEIGLAYRNKALNMDFDKQKAVLSSKLQVSRNEVMRVA